MENRLPSFLPSVLLSWEISWQFFRELLLGHVTSNSELIVINTYYTPDNKCCHHYEQSTYTPWTTQ